MTIYKELEANPDPNWANGSRILTFVSLNFGVFDRIAVSDKFTPRVNKLFLPLDSQLIWVLLGEGRKLLRNFEHIAMEVVDVAGATDFK